MARDEKRIELRPVDEIEETAVPVIRIESEETLLRRRPQRRKSQPEEDQIYHRLDLPEQDTFEARTHQPGIEALVEQIEIDRDALEGNWGDESDSRAGFAWGWFALIALLLTGALIWSLTRVNKADVQIEQFRVSTRNAVDLEAQADKDASRLIDRIDKITRQYFKATTIESLLPLVRHPERVRPLMEKYFANQPMVANPLVSDGVLQPLTIDNNGSFWLKSFELSDRKSRSVLIEVDETGEPKLDWETLVCYQPMPWDKFATERPSGISLDFRVYVAMDNLFSHEFANPDLWACFALTALESDEILFGYAKAGSTLAQEIQDTVNRNREGKTSMILRLSVPEGLESHRGVMIEKVMSHRWIYVEAPDTNP